MPSDVLVAQLAAPELPRVIAELRGVYLAAFRQPPHSESARDADAWIRILSDHVEHPGFRMLVARRADRIIGFIYGHDNITDDWWWRQVRDDIDEHTGADLDPERCYTIPELAVIPEEQGRGVGQALHDALVELVSTARILLTVRADAQAPRTLYERSGWAVIATGQWFDSGDILLMSREPQIAAARA